MKRKIERETQNWGILPVNTWPIEMNTEGGS